MGVSSAKRGHLFYLSIEGCGIWGYGSASHWTRGISYVDSWAMHPPFLFWSCQKRNGPCTVQREKTLRRVGLRQRRPPAAGGGRLAVPCGSQGRKRAVLGESFGPGKLGIHPASLFAAAGGWSMKVAAWVNATVSTTARAARSEAERAERGAVQMRPCTPTRLEPPPRDGSADFAEENSVPEGQPKSEQAPIRRPPSRAEGHCTGARQAPFSFGPCTARFLFGQDRKENGGCIAQLATQLYPPGG